MHVDSLNIGKSQVNRSKFGALSLGAEARLDVDPFPIRRRCKRKRYNVPPGPLRTDEIECTGQNSGSIQDKFYFYQTLGKLHTPSLITFEWGDQIGCRGSLGRQYYDSFSLQSRKFDVGHFVMQTFNDGEQLLFKVMSAFQAIHSVRGLWSRGHLDEEELLQKRGEWILVYLAHASLFVLNLTLLSSGHAYIEVIPLLPLTSKDKLKASREVYLKTADKYHVSHVQAIPIDLFDEDYHFEHAVVRVDLPDDAEDPNAFVCSRLRGHQKLSDEQKQLLLETVPLNLLSCVYSEWAPVCKAKAVHLGKHARPILGANDPHPGPLPYHPTHFSSDDSDSCQFDLVELKKSRRAHKSISPGVRSSIRAVSQVVEIITKEKAWKWLQELNPGFVLEDGQYSIPYSDGTIRLDKLEACRAKLCKDGVPLKPGVSSVDYFLDESLSNQLEQWVRFAIVPHLTEVVVNRCYTDKHAQLALIKVNAISNRDGWSVDDKKFSTFSDLKNHLRRNGLAIPMKGHDVDEAMTFIAQDHAADFPVL
jgi:hypothetical protein